MVKEDNTDITAEYLAARSLAFAILWQCVKDLNSRSKRLRKDAENCIKSEHIKYLCDSLGIDHPSFLKLSLHYNQKGE